VGSADGAEEGGHTSTISVTGESSNPPPSPLRTGDGDEVGLLTNSISGTGCV
jgi:hypothetical protein